MYLQAGREVPSPDPAAGLYIRTHRHGVVQARIPADHLAFQMGEASQACSSACPGRQLHFLNLSAGLPSGV